MDPTCVIGQGKGEQQRLRRSGRLTKRDCTRLTRPSRTIRLDEPGSRILTAAAWGANREGTRAMMQQRRTQSAAAGRRVAKDGFRMAGGCRTPWSRMLDRVNLSAADERPGLPAVAGGNGRPHRNGLAGTGWTDGSRGHHARLTSIRLRKRSIIIFQGEGDVKKAVALGRPGAIGWSGSRPGHGPTLPAYHPCPPRPSS